MMQPSPQKNDEHDPLLKMETGTGDAGCNPASLPSTRWSVVCAPRKYWNDRWPELFSACWMAGMLLGILILIVYGLGTFGVIRRSPRALMTCNKSKSTMEIHYHYFIEDGVDVPFGNLSNHLVFMKAEYPGLHFNVIFLINDIRGYRRILSFKRDDQINELQSFSNLYSNDHNIKVTVMHLSKYLAETPWRFKWRKIHPSYLIFYLRVHSVWKSGGIAMRIGTYSDLSTLRTVEDPAVETILRKYSEGIEKAEEDLIPPSKINRDEQGEFMSLFYGVVQLLLNETRSFLNRTNTLSQIHPEQVKPSVQARHKRELSETLNAMDINVTTELKGVNVTTKNVSDSIYKSTNEDSETNYNNFLLKMFERNLPPHNESAKIDEAKISINSSTSNASNSLKNDSRVPQILILYDFSVISENVGPSYVYPGMLPVLPNFPENLDKSESRFENIDTPPKLRSSKALTMALDGSFIATPSKNHVLLGHIISSTCQQMAPRYIIQNAFLTHCSPIFTNNDFCRDIYFI